jgi:hypothetical protein
MAVPLAFLRAAPILFLGAKDNTWRQGLATGFSSAIVRVLRRGNRVDRNYFQA